MNTIKNRILSIFVFILSMTVSPTALFAFSCTTTSPNKQKGLDAFTPIPKNEISDSVSEQVFNFFKQLEGNWQGEGEAVVCELHFGDLHINQSQQTIKLEMERVSDKEYRAVFKVYNVKNKLNWQYNFIIHRKNKFIDIMGEGNVEINRISGKDIDFVTQSLAGNASGGVGSRPARLSFETVRNLRLSGGTLVFEKAEFFNGVIANYSRWELIK